MPRTIGEIVDPGDPQRTGRGRSRKYLRTLHLDVKEGVGIGLGVSPLIIEAHEGQLWAENYPDVDVRFTLNLPLVKMRAQARPREATRLCLQGICNLSSSCELLLSCCSPAGISQSGYVRLNVFDDAYREIGFCGRPPCERQRSSPCHTAA